MKIILLVAISVLLCRGEAVAQDNNLHIYLCFGQSNMEGQGKIEAQDLLAKKRFKVFQAMDCPNLNRVKGNWYPAVPPTCQCYSQLSIADYFGRTMVDNLPDSISVGIINVAIGGCDIRLFDKDLYTQHDSTYTDRWFSDKINYYQGNPYQYLVNLAQKAQKDGTIKGILLHQGETNTDDRLWPTYVKKIYHDMLKDLSLKEKDVPLLAGEVVSQPGSCCASMNTIIDNLPQTIPTAHVVSSKDCTAQDKAHFDSEGYRKLGRRYGAKMLSLQGYKAVQLEKE